jgi:hypothetical protein
MHVGRISGFTNILGAPKDWDKQAHGPCGGLPVRVEKTTAGIGMTSAWLPTPEEIGRIMAGAPIYLTIIGEVHPPVSMSVGAPPDALGSAT